MADNTPRNTPQQNAPRTAPRDAGHPEPARSRAQVKPGMLVQGMDGSRVGRVKAVEEGQFSLDRPKAPDLNVPMDAVMEIRNGSLVVLRVPSTLIHQQGWQTTTGGYW
jgi:hypothetical protein